MVNPSSEGRGQRHAVTKPPLALHIEDAREAERVEREETVGNAVVSNPKIILLCVFANLGPFVYGFDSIAFSLCLSMTPFQETFGQYTDGSYIIPAYWQSLWNAVTQLTVMVGAAMTGFLADRLGRRVVFFVGGAISMAGIAVAYMSSTPSIFLAGKMINGLSLGLLTTTGVTYISEITPLHLRGICLSALIFSTNLGCLIACSIAYPRMNIVDNSSWRVLIASEWAWPAIVILGAFLIPESPHYLVRRKRPEAAARMLRRLRNKEADINGILDDIVLVHEQEKLSHVHSKKRFLECFQQSNWRRTRIILYMNAFGQLIGASFINNAPYFLIQAGMSSSDEGMIVEISFALGVVISIITWFFMDTIGRRALLFIGMGSAAVLYMAMGIAGCFPGNPKAEWAVGILALLVTCTNGPVTGASTGIAGEISQVELRAESQAIGFAFNYFFCTVWQVAVPYMFNSDEGNLGGKMGWIFFVTSVIGLAITYFEVPETKNLSYAELDEMFTDK